MRDFKDGDLVCHFKWHNNTDKQIEENNYVYKVVKPSVKHTESGEILVVYEAQYGDNLVFARPKDMFLSEVDRTKYPNVEQRYRLIKYDKDKLIFWRGLSKEEKSEILSSTFSLKDFLDKYKLKEDYYGYFRSNFIIV